MYDRYLGAGSMVDFMQEGREAKAYCRYDDNLPFGFFCKLLGLDLPVVEVVL